jgi:hypothetical protein
LEEPTVDATQTQRWGQQQGFVPSQPAAGGGGGDLTEELIQTDVWTDDMLARAGIPVADAAFVTCGGGVGSYIMVDYLRIAGVPTSQIRVLSGIDYPWQTYKYLTAVSQIPPGERLRSDSASTPDCIWGFPSYAVREALSNKGFTKKLAPLFQVAVEPIFTDYYTPRAGQAFNGMARELERIRYNETLVKGQVRMVRRRYGGGYFTILTPPEGASATKRVAFRSTYVHLALGYPGLKFLDDLQEYRTKYQDFSKVVAAYEPHEHVYEELKRRPGSLVVIRGGGIVASRILQRLMDDRKAFNTQVQIAHVLRTYITGAHGPSIFKRRKGGDGWAYQGFNYPKSVWGGQLKSQVRKSEGEQRAKLYKEMGGTNTPKRKLWQQQMKEGRTQGWYRVFAGQVLEVMPGPDQTIITKLKTDQGVYDVPAHFIIDCTGLEADLREHRVMADLLDHSGAGRNPVGRLDVERDFEVRGTRSEPGRMFASGSMTLGGYFPGVDTFLGLQIAALEITDTLASLGFCKKLGPGRSISQWWKWARNKPVE